MYNVFFFLYLPICRIHLELFLRPLWCIKLATAHIVLPPLRAQSWFSSQCVRRLQPANHNFPPLTCSACGVVALATTPSQEWRCSISTGLLDLRSHSSLHMTIWEKQSQRNMCPLFYLSQVFSWFCCTALRWRDDKMSFFLSVLVWGHRWVDYKRQKWSDEYWNKMHAEK